ncbi:MAG: F0F1 ATP synthase subunit epsilon [Caldilineae bacterium]|nr:MAG: F0F1 ATP synthase subunit epsilon [Caldilineae bacterium]
MPIQLEIVTVERLLYSDEVDMVIAPGSEGVLGILPHHAPLLTSLNYGELIVRKQGEEDQSFAIGGGFIEVQPDKVTVLADTAERADEINLERAKAARDRAAKLIEEGGLSMDDLIRAEAAMRRALARIKVAEKRRRRPSAPQQQR